MRALGSGSDLPMTPEVSRSPAREPIAPIGLEDPIMSQTRTISPIWVLLLVPVGLVGGWAVGKFSDPGKVPVEPASMGATTPANGSFSAWSSFAEAMTESERTGKPILLDFNAEWCPPCQAMRRTVFENSKHSQSIQRAVIPVSIVDRVREDGRNVPEVDQLQNRYGVQAFPTLVVFHPKSGKQVSTRGFGGPDATAEWIARAVEEVE